MGCVMVSEFGLCCIAIAPLLAIGACCLCGKQLYAVAIVLVRAARSNKSHPRQWWSVRDAVLGAAADPFDAFGNCTYYKWLWICVDVSS